MYEALILSSLVVLVVLAIRGGKPVVFDNPLVVRRPGRYHITLAPQLADAQVFLEHVAGRFAETGVESGDVATQYFEVRDPGAAGHYLLAAGVRAGVVYFQGLVADAADGNYRRIHRYAEQVMADCPLAENIQDAGPLHAAVDHAAGLLQIVCMTLQASERDLKSNRN